MKAKINEKIICIPPYVSTSWEHVSFMQTEEEVDGSLNLVLHLDDSKSIRIHHLDKALIDLAFGAHLRHLEARSEATTAKPREKVQPLAFLQNLLGIPPEQMESLSIRMGFGIPGVDNLEMVMHHNPAAADAADLPKEVLDKIMSISKLLLNGELTNFPKPEPHCNCHHCQLARAVHGIEKNAAPQEETPVTDEELTFRQWEIQQNGEKLYTVSNPLDPKEQYSVYLGTPVGCTCGQAHCEHIKAVLLN